MAGSQVEVVVRCALPGGAHSGVVGVKTLLAHNQSVEVGYNFSRSDQSVVGFASVSASLSPLGARTDIAPVPQAAANRSGVIELRVFVDGHMVRRHAAALVNSSANFW